MKYTKPELEIVEFEMEDVITTSTLLDGGDGTEDGDINVPVSPGAKFSIMD